MKLLDRILDASIVYSFDKSGYLRHAKNFRAEEWNGSGKVALVTGANSGIGFETARQLLAYGTTVHLLCRSQERGQRALEELNSSNTQLHIVDVSDPQGTADWAKNHAPAQIDILINNAGGMPDELSYNSYGDELTWASQVLGHYTLTETLISEKKLTPAARVITVASGGMYLQKLDLSDLRWEKRPYDKYKAYANAKRAQVILNELWNEKYGPDICFSCMHPGWVDTSGVRTAMPEFYSALGKRLRNLAEGADTIVWLALTPHSYPGGKFWFDRAEAPTHKFWFTQDNPQDRQLLLQILKETSS